MLATLRARLALWYAGINGLVLLAFALLVYGFVDQALYRGVEDGARVVASTVLATITLAPEGPRVNQASFTEAAADATAYQGIAGIDVRDATGRLVAGYGLSLAAPRAGAGEDQLLDLAGNGLWLHAQPLVRGGRVLGSLRIARSLSDVQRTLHDFALVLAALVPLALLATVGGGLWMAGKVMEPIQASIERLRRFTADASHELRTPLAIIQAQADAVASTPPADAEALQRAIEPIQRAGRRMSALVGDLLFLARSDASSVELALTTLELDELVEDTVDEYAPLARAKGLAIAFEGVPTRVQGDPQRLHQLVANLIDNAIKYTDTGGVTVSVQAPVGPLALVRIVDSGTGIAPDQLPRVFDRFYRSDEARSARRPGTGLGLAIARAIAQAHGGEIRIQSELGQGTQMTVSLPQA